MNLDKGVLGDKPIDKRVLNRDSVQGGRTPSNTDRPYKCLSALNRSIVEVGGQFSFGKREIGIGLNGQRTFAIGVARYKKNAGRSPKDSNEIAQGYGRVGARSCGLDEGKRLLIL
ncbi:MAG: hypothetical protein HY928_02335 [Elusimicrobia bacterium]|nr:hypothetical protein [Elusimicrobiota bacterium]